MAHSMVLARKKYLHGETTGEVDEVVTVVVDCSTAVLGVGTILLLMLLPTSLMEGGVVRMEAYKKT